MKFCSNRTKLPRKLRRLPLPKKKAPSLKFRQTAKTKNEETAIAEAQPAEAEEAPAEEVPAEEVSTEIAAADEVPAQRDRKSVV